MSQFISGMTKCLKCGKDKISVNEEQQCLTCDVPAGTSTLKVICDDPGEEKIAQVLAAAGVRIPRPEVKKKEQTTNPSLITSAAVYSGASFEDCIKSALKVMRTLPMPKDVK